MIPRMSTNKANIYCLMAVAVCATLIPSSLHAQIECSRTVELDLVHQDEDEVRVSRVADFGLGRAFVDTYLEHLVDPENDEYLDYFEDAVGGLLSSPRPPICAAVRARRNTMYEIGIFLLGVPTRIGHVVGIPFPPPLQLRVTRHLAGTEVVGQFLYDRSFREVNVSRGGAETSQFWLTEIMLDRDLLMNFMDYDGTWWDPGERYWDGERNKEEPYKVMDMISSLELHIVVRRIDDYCTLSASVSGDINQHFFGDLAYFNAVATPVKKGMMVGTIGETQAHESVDGFGTVNVSGDEALSMAARLGLISEEEREEAAQELAENEAEQVEDEPTAEAQGFAGWMQQELRADDPSEGDNFGLNLADLKFDADPKTEVEDFNDNMDELWSGPETLNAEVGAMFAGAFTLTLSGRVDVNEFDAGPQQDESPRFITVTPSTITASVGLSDKGGDRIPFEMIEGSSVQGTIEISKENVDFIIGSLAVELETKGVYTLEGGGAYTQEGITYTSRGQAIRPRKLKIQVVANFAARRGSLACGQ